MFYIKIAALFALFAHFAADQLLIFFFIVSHLFCRFLQHHFIIKQRPPFDLSALQHIDSVLSNFREVTVTG